MTEERIYAKKLAFTGLSRPSGAIRPGYFFIFLAHDPLFGDPQNFPPADPELQDLNRQLVLSTLELVFVWADARMRDVKKLSRTLELERWTLSEARELISAEDWQRLMIQREVNRMDPDFQCADAAQCIKQPRPLVEVLSKTER